ncbi:hypothetical protein HYW40_02370, partial [Candidatus Curtissbacteria bacterium]|nr:hypothetical protein [Candidatus Curtissbacteria bacterium]
MYAQVVVLTYQPPEIDSYTYEIPKSLNAKIGQLVSVPFGKRNPQGIILSINSRHPGGSETTDRISRSDSIDPSGLQNDKVLKIKPINSILLDQPIFLPYQIELLKWMSAYYIAPMANCVKAILPELPSKSKIVNSKWKESIHLDPQSEGRGSHGSVYSPFTIHQTLVLVPNIDRIPETLANFPQAKNYVLYHNQLKTSEKFAAWQKILSGGCDFIFGSRLAIFTPCPNLKKIIIFDEHDGAYKDERSPYFDTLTIAEKISELTKSKIEIIDLSPRVTTYHLFRHSGDERSRRLRVKSKSENSRIKQIRFWTGQNDKALTVPT